MRAALEEARNQLALVRRQVRAARVVVQRCALTLSQSAVYGMYAGQGKQSTHVLDLPREEAA
jgi:hypothetical protein